MKSVIDQLKEFVKEDSWPRNKWLTDDKMQLYVRHGFHMLPAADFSGSIRTECLDLASFEVYKQKQGTFTKVLEDAHEMNPWSATFIENVLNEHLPTFLLRNGFMPYEQSFYKLKN